MRHKDNYKTSGSILIVEDDKKIFNGLKRCLEKAGFRVDPVFLGTYDSIMRRINRINPIMLFVDIELKDEEGRTGLELIREQRKRRSIPVLIISSKIKTLDYEEQIKVLGVDGFVSKDLNQEDIEVNTGLALARYRPVKVTFEYKGQTQERFLMPSEIAYITSYMKKRSHVYTLDGEQYYCPKSLAEHLRYLSNDTFMKVNRSHIVNLQLDRNHLVYNRTEKTLLVGTMQKEISVGDDFGEAVRARLERRRIAIKHPKKK